MTNLQRMLSARFVRVTQADKLFHPTLTVSILYITDEARPQGKVVRTYRNEPTLNPGRTVWVFLSFDSSLTGIESRVSLDDLESQVLERLEGGKQ